MSGRSAPMPPWAQYFLVPALLFVVWVVGQTVGHVLFVFIVSVVVALMLNPLVRIVRRARIPRGLAVLVVYLTFVAAVAGSVFLVVGPVQDQVREIRQNLPAYTDQGQRRIQDIQDFLNRHGIHVNVQEKLDSAIQTLRDKVGELADNIVTYSLDFLSALVTFVIILVASIYMLLDAPRIARFAQRIGGPGAGTYLRRTERGLVEYVKAQLLVSAIIAVTAGVVLWIYGITGIFPAGATFAVAFAAWVFVMEFVPYLGPILGAVPPVLLALFSSPVAAIWVIVAFVFIHQLEGHIVVPKIFGTAVGVHPLVVIFGLLVGEQLYGLPGVLLAIPLVVICKESVVYFSERVGMARWREETELGGPAAPPEPGPAPAVPPDPGPPPPAPPEYREETQEVPTRVVEAPGVRRED
jgi:predicted PurR-regulated permease PerM